MADKRRRKSLRLFRPRPETPPTSITSTDSTSSPEKYGSGFPEDSDSASPRVRPRTLQKSHRTSIFGSWRSLQSLDEDEKITLTQSESQSSSIQDERILSARGALGEHAKMFGEVQAPGSSLFKKRVQYLVLSETHLIRFKSQSKAAEMFPMIPPTMTKASAPRNTVSSIGSNNEMQMNVYLDITQGVPLEEVVAVYRLDDGKPFFTLEVAYLDERGKRTSTMQISFNEPREAENWTNAIQNGCDEAKKLKEKNMLPQTMEHVARFLERETDYDPLHLRVFKVVQRALPRVTGRLPSEDVGKSQSVVSYLAIGINKVHLIPGPRTSTRSSSTSLSDGEASSFGITSITSIRLRNGENTCQVTFRKPLKAPVKLLLSSFDVVQIVLWLRYSSEYLRPEWTVQPFTFDVPAEFDDQMNPPSFPLEDNNCFDRTLIAYCASLDVDTTRIYYSVDFHCEDAPCFRLLPSVDSPSYSAFELLAVFRSLRYNESFVSISFANVDLTPLRDLYDPVAGDEDSVCTRSGTVINISGHENLSILSQEVRALALKSRRLRRLDFTHSITSSPLVGEHRRSCGLPEALTPLCKKSLTNVDWIVFNGIQLSDTDLDFLVDAASERRCHLRALEIGDCGLSVHDIDVLLSTLGAHNSTMEVVDISGAQGRFSPELFHRSIGAFAHIRRLNLTRVQKTAGSVPLLTPEILLEWRLETLQLSQTTLNEQSVETIAAYLASPKSDTLRELSLNQCGLCGKDLALFFRSMTREVGEARNLHVSASENRLGKAPSELSRCIAEGYGPASLTARMMDFEKEVYFRELIIALTSNTTLRSLDISRASLPYDAGPETCEALKEMFSRNQTLEELDISGEVAHLDSTRFGIGLNTALLGLEKNTTLKLLRIEHQNLGLQGASTLAGVIESNKSLLEIHCEHNEINLQSFTVLVNALEKNRTLLYLPTQETDRAKSMEKVREEFEAIERAEEPQSPKVGALKKSFHALSSKGSRHQRFASTVSGHSVSSVTDKDVSAAITALDERWHTQVSRLQRCLLRNYQLATGVPWSEENDRSSDWFRSVPNVHDRPSTQDSLSKLFARVKMDRTPTMEKASPLDMTNEKMDGSHTPVFQLPED